MKARVLSLATALLLAIGCDRRPPVAGIDTVRSAPAPRPQRGIYLSVSSLAPRAGDTIVVAATLAEDSISLGSFRVRLAYDRTRMEFAGDAPVGGLRVVNPARDEIIVAGASGSTPEHRLFELRFRVDDPTGLQSLLLRIDELNDASFANRAQQVAQPAALVLEPSLAGGSAPSASGSSGAAVATSQPASAPVIDSVSPRSGEVSAERVTDIVLYGKHFASSGNVVTFGGAMVSGLLSESGGTVIRFAAPTQVPLGRTGTSRRVSSGAVLVRVRTTAGTSNGVTFVVKADR